MRYCTFIIIIIVHLYKDKIPANVGLWETLSDYFQAKTGIVRAAKVTTVIPTKEPIVVKRPIQKLFPIKAKSEKRSHEHSVENANVNDQSDIEIKMVMDDDIVQHIIGQ